MTLPFYDMSRGTKHNGFNHESVQTLIINKNSQKVNLFAERSFVKKHEITIFQL